MHAYTYYGIGIYFHPHAGIYARIKPQHRGINLPIFTPYRRATIVQIIQKLLPNIRAHVHIGWVNSKQTRKKTVPAPGNNILDSSRIDSVFMRITGAVCVCVDVSPTDRVFVLQNVRLCMPNKHTHTHHTL